MARFRSILRQLRSERGHTLPELMYVVMLLLIILVVVLLVSQLVARNEPRIRERAGEIDQARVLVERLDRELRLSSRIDFAAPNRIVFEGYVRRLACGGAVPPGGDNRAAVSCEIDYTCSAGICSRTERAPATGVGTGGTTREMVRGLSNSTPFSCIPDCSLSQPTLSTISWIGVSFAFPATDGEDSITLSGGTNLRNT
jgi:hypothetical protein